MRKTASIFLAASLMLSLAACSKGSDSSAQATPTTADSTAATETTATAETNGQFTFEETVLVDNEKCTFKITAIEDDSIGGYTLKAYLENKTDLELMFSLNNVSVNGFMCDPFWAASVTPGMKANEEISFSSDSFDRNGIETVTDLTFTLKVYDNNDWTADPLVEEEFTIYPMGEESVQPYERTATAGEIVLFEDDNCAMIVTGFDPDSIWGYTMNVYLENKTDKNLMFSIGDASVNGYMCDPFWAETVAAGKRSNTTVSWSSEDLESNGITDVEELTLPITVYDADNWSDSYLVEDTFTVNP